MILRDELRDAIASGSNLTQPLPASLQAEQEGEPEGGSNTYLKSEAIASTKHGELESWSGEDELLFSRLTE